jgi:hypothetical protein
MLSTAESSGGTASTGAYSARIQNKIQCSLDDVTFGASLGEGKSHTKHLIKNRCFW